MNLGIIKVPERIARFSACIAVFYLQVCTEVGQKQTALQYWVHLHPGQRERSVSLLQLWGEGSHALGHRKLILLSTTRVMKTQNRT